MVQIDQDRRALSCSRERPCGGVFEIDMWRGRCQHDAPGQHCHALQSPLSTGEKDHRKGHIASTAGEAGFQTFHDRGARGCGGRVVPTSRSTLNWRSPITRSVTSATTHSMPAFAPASSASGEYEKVW